MGASSDPAAASTETAEPIDASSSHSSESEAPEITLLVAPLEWKADATRERVFVVDTGRCVLTFRASTERVRQRWLRALKLEHAMCAHQLASGAQADFFLHAMCGCAEAVAAALAAGQPVDAVDDEGATALMGAAAKGHLPVVVLLLEGGAGVDLKAGPGLTALLMAASEGHLPVVQRLLAAGADASAELDGMSAAELAAEGGHADVVKCLEQAVAER